MEIEKALADFSQAALDLLARRNESIPVVAVREERVDFSELGARQTRSVVVPLFRGYVSEAFCEIASLSVTQAVTSALLQHPDFELPRILNDQTPIQPSEEQLKRHVYEKLAILLSSYAEKYGSFHFDADFVTTHVRGFCSVWIAKEVSHVVSVPLVAFISDFDEIRISDTVRLQRFTPEMKDRLWKASLLSSPPIDVHVYGSCQFVLESYYTSPSPIKRASHPALPNAERAILALRLLKPDPVWPGVYFDEVVPHEFGSSRGGGRSSEWSPLPSERTPYHIKTTEEIRRVQEMYRLLEVLAQDGRLGDLHVGIRRFGRTYTRENDEDKLIDLTIALENTLLFGLRDELQYRLSLRGAALLASRVPVERTHVMLKTIYEVRSGIVHSGKSLNSCTKELKKVGFSPGEFVSESMQLLRGVLAELVLRLSGGEKLTEILGDLDARILDGVRDP